MANSYRMYALYVVIFVVFVFMSIGVISFNRWTSSQIKGVEKTTRVTPKTSRSEPVLLVPDQPDLSGTASDNSAKSVETSFISGPYTRRTMIDPSRKFMRNVILANGKEVGFFKSDGDKIFDVSGFIPEGRVEFADDYAGTLGEENFKDGQRQGDYLEYYSDRKIRRKKIYHRGKLKYVEEYFSNGQLRMSIDYQDALIGSEQKESGAGKIFNNEGQLLYEWSLTIHGAERYKKFYNTAGQLVEYLRYDSTGRLLEHQKFNPESL